MTTSTALPAFMDGSALDKDDLNAMIAYSVDLDANDILITHQNLQGKKIGKSSAGDKMKVVSGVTTLAAVSTTNGSGQSTIHFAEPFTTIAPAVTVTPICLSPLECSIIFIALDYFTVRFKSAGATNLTPVGFSYIAVGFV